MRGEEKRLAASLQAGSGEAVEKLVAWHAEGMKEKEKMFKGALQIIREGVSLL